MTLSSHDRNRIEALAASVLRDYETPQPPIPIERILTQPPRGLEAIDVRDLSLVLGIGEHRYEYRLALGRLLYREICRVASSYQEEDAPDLLPYSSEAARHFATSILVPAGVLKAAVGRRGATLSKVSELFQVPEYALASRLVYLGWHVAGME